MSNQSWIRRSSPSSSKNNGPLKATLPMSSLTRQNSNLRHHSQDNSPVTLSPTSPWKTRASPDQILSGIRSPGALNYKGKYHVSKSHNSASIRRTASLDTIYLTGQWPRDIHTSLLHLDKATQTDELEGKKGQRYTPDFSVMTEEKLDKMIRHRLLQRSATSRDGLHHPRPTMQEHSSQTSGTPPPLVHPLPLPIPAVRSRPATMRSSTEGLNQEIERLVLRAMSSLGSEGEEEKAIQITPEGHRAPLPDLLRLTRSVNTQTLSGPQGDTSDAPRDRTLESRDLIHSSGSSSLGDSPSHHFDSAKSVALLSPARLLIARDFMSPRSPRCVARQMSDESPMSSPGDGEECGGGDTSPKINRFLAREPPDGCERVCLKFTEDSSSKDLSLIDYCDLKPCVTFQLKPSAGSAFLPLSTAALASHGAPAAALASHGASETPPPSETTDS